MPHSTSFRPTNTVRRSRRRERGQSLVEFAIFVPIMLLILLVTVDFGRVFMGWVNVHNMARIGANFAATNPDAWQAPDSTRKANLRARYGELMTADATAVNCTLAPLAPPAFGGYTVGSNVTVNIGCGFSLITPFMANLIGDGSGNVPITAAATFTVRAGGVGGATVGGGPLPTPTASPTPPPTPTPTPSPSPSPTPNPDSSASPDPTPSPSPTLPPVEIAFYGTPTSEDSYGGGPPGSPSEDQIVGLPGLNVSFSNETSGLMVACAWDFGDGTTSDSCSSTVSKSYSGRGTYHVTLTVNGQALTRASYVLVGCKVPSFSGVRKNSASTLWTDAGFSSTNLTTESGNGNYYIGSQSLAGGMVNPPGGCDARITVGP